MDKRCCWNRRVLKTVTELHRETQVSAETSGNGNTVNININTNSEMLAVSTEVVPLNCSH